MRRGPRLPPEELAPYRLELPDPPAPFDWARVFGADRPVEIEIGFGKGMFLVNAGQSRPDLHFVGVEIVRKYQLFTATRLAKRGLHNVRVACADGRLFLRDRVALGVASRSTRLLSRSLVEETPSKASLVHGRLRLRVRACLTTGRPTALRNGCGGLLPDGCRPDRRSTHVAASPGAAARRTGA